MQADVEHADRYCYFILTVVQWTINLAPYNCMGAGWGVREVGWKHE